MGRSLWGRKRRTFQRKWKEVGRWQSMDQEVRHDWNSVDEAHGHNVRKAS